MGKSIVTATFERAVDKHYFTEQQSYHPACGIEHAGMGAYHIEYDYPGNPDYPQCVQLLLHRILLLITKRKG